MKKEKGFTLVELLVVIAIIAGLSALSAPVVMKALTKAKIANAQQACVALSLAIEQFENDYNYLPYTDSIPESDNNTPIRSDSDFMNVLCGKEDEVNFKENKYFKFNDAKGGKGGLVITNTKAELFDPWGQPYYIVLDYDLDGEIDNPTDKNKIVSGKLAVIYSKGPDGKIGSMQKNRDNADNL
ncbi:MAG: type II secretion system protein [Akkermansiaceae bacterium]